MSAHPAIIDWPEDPSDARGMALWTSDELATAMGAAVSTVFEVAGIEIDSREVAEGDLFFALKGDASDGHKFLDGAFARGAAAAVVDRAIAGLGKNLPHVLVGDTFVALEALARASRARLEGSAKIIGVTGSAGKTGVKEALFTALDRGSSLHGGGGRAHRSLKSYNNHVGVPLSLARMPSRTQFGVFEMGMNHSGELSQLTRLVRPHVAIVTTIAPAHIGYGWVYPGPMGSVLTPSLIGIEKAGHLANASTFCGKCESVCPVKIPLPKLMRHWREREFERHLTPGAMRNNLAIWGWFARRPQLYRAATRAAAWGLGLLGRKRGRFTWLPFAGGWTGGRDLPAPEGDTFFARYARQQRNKS